MLRRIIPPRSETSAVGTTVALAAVVGVGAGLMALATDWLIRALNRRVFFQIGARADLPAEPWHLLLIFVPAAVFLAVAFGIRRFAPETAGAGIPQVMSAVGRQGGHIHRRVIPAKAFATALSIGAGAPLGMEGPVVHTGAAVGSLLGRRFRMGVANIRILVAAGAAAGLAAKYGAPIGGAVFSSELILGSASTAALLPLIVASFLAVVTRHFVAGPGAEYAISIDRAFGVDDYLLFVALGVAAGLAAAYFIKTIFVTDDLMNRLFTQWWARAVFGGLAVGLAALLMPALLGTGKPIIQRLLDDPGAAVRVLVIFMLLKPILCSVALGSGVSGGIFAPALFTGAALGALFVRAAAGVGPDEMASSAYVLAGMAAVMGAVMRAPLQAILVAFELTHNYTVIPALMITCVIALKISELFEPESAFTRRLVRQGERIRRGMDFGLLNGMSVTDVIERDYVALPASATIDGVRELVRRSENRTFPVVEEDGRLRGVVMLATLIGAAAGARETGRPPPLAELIDPELVFLEPETPLGRAWERMSNYDYDCLPVCADESDGPRIVGICEKEAILELHDRLAFVGLTEGR